MFTAPLKAQLLFGFVLGFTVSLMTMCTFVYIMGDLTTVVSYVPRNVNVQDRYVIQVPEVRTRQHSDNSIQSPNSKEVYKDNSRDVVIQMPNDNSRPKEVPSSKKVDKDASTSRDVVIQMSNDNLRQHEIPNNKEMEKDASRDVVIQMPRDNSIQKEVPNSKEVYKDNSRDSVMQMSSDNSRQEELPSSKKVGKDASTSIQMPRDNSIQKELPSSNEVYKDASRDSVIQMSNDNSRQEELPSSKKVGKDASTSIQMPRDNSIQKELPSSNEVYKDASRDSVIQMSNDNSIQNEIPSSKKVGKDASTSRDVVMQMSRDNSIQEELPSSQELETYGSRDSVMQMSNDNWRQEEVPNSTDASVLFYFMEEMEEIQNERQETLRLACDKYHSDVHMDPDLPKRSSLYNNKYSFSICRIYKVASSSWLRAVLVSDGFFTKQDIMEEKIMGDDVINLAQKKRSISSLNSTTEEKEVWARSTNIITVRNPLARIVSAYVDKMIRRVTKTYKNLAWYVEVMYKPLRQNVKARRNRYTGVPTFEDFVNFLLDKDSRYTGDPHWRDYNSFCHPCEHKYDLIMKLETLEDDTAYLHEKLNISKEDYSLIIPAQPASNQRTTLKGSGDLSVSEYFASLPLHLRRGVYRKYQFDFDAFGYASP